MLIRRWRQSRLDGIGGSPGDALSNLPSIDLELGRPSCTRTGGNPLLVTALVANTKGTERRTACFFLKKIFILCMVDGWPTGWSVDHPDHPLGPPLLCGNVNENGEISLAPKQSSQEPRCIHLLRSQPSLRQHQTPWYASSAAYCR
jgi:hypothetical protein